MTRSSLSTGRATATVIDAYMRRTQRLSTPPLVYAHGAGADASQLVGDSVVPSVRLLMRTIVEHGFTAVATTTTQLWGNTTDRSRHDDVVTWSRSSLDCTAQKVVLIGASMGATSVLSWAYANPSLVACLVGIIPAIDLEDIRTNNTLSERANIDAAWGVTYPAALPAGANPAANTATLSAIPMQLWYSSDDAVSNNIGTFATATSADLHNLGALGHTDAAIAAVDVGTVLSFIDAHIA